MTKFIDFSKLRKNEDKERKLKEYIKEYQRVCNTITEDDIYYKQVLLAKQFHLDNFCSQ